MKAISALFIVLLLTACGEKKEHAVASAPWVEGVKSCGVNVTVDPQVLMCLNSERGLTRPDVNQLGFYLDDCFMDTFYVIYGQIGYEQLLDYDYTTADFNSFSFNYDDNGTPCTNTYSR